jgi:alanine-glyoxylate transaminase/serine-glyoxylate transaminase/serine-pyruvate transaminase
MSSTQAPHPTLLIPGPVEFDDGVLQAMAHYSESHVSPGFIGAFGDALAKLRRLLQTTAAAGSQPFVISGSGTLGWDLVAANIVEPGERVLVLNCGYFGDSFGACLETYGVAVQQLGADAVGGRPSLDEVERVLRGGGFAAVTATHVDTSTGVLMDVRALAEVVRRAAPETLLVVDGVCSVGCEEIAFDEWGLDAVITAGQKAIGCPPGLSISMFSARAMDKFARRKTPPGSYFASMKNWLPIMRAYEAKKPSYFATPPVQLIYALNAAFDAILARPLAERFARHAEVSDRIKAAVAALGLEQVAARPEDRAHGMTAIRLPQGALAPDVLPGLAKRGFVMAAGLHKALGASYIRFGHMGVSVMDPERKDIDNALKALEEAFSDAGLLKK